MSLALSLLKLSVNQPLAESLMIPQVEADLTLSQGMPLGKGICLLPFLSKIQIWPSYEPTNAIGVCFLHLNSLESPS